MGDGGGTATPRPLLVLASGFRAAIMCHMQLYSVPTQFKATQLVVAIAVWAIQRSDPYFNLSILLLNASEQYYITIG
jgi:hypothetical protein